jgi:polyhydroxyalkanoate synthesis repressor PhaR
MGVIKKYSNRRLYDTVESRYITLEELAQIIRGGRDVQVLDAKSGQDLTQATLAQIILESRGAAKLLPIPVLMNLIRMGDDALAEFFGAYTSWALELYLRMKQGAQMIAAYNPLGQIPIPGMGALGQLAGGTLPWSTPEIPGTRGNTAPPPESSARDEVADLRRELEALKRQLEGSEPE